jgi:Leu/Phe-tRNA-protein transferase
MRGSPSGTNTLSFCAHHFENSLAPWKQNDEYRMMVYFDFQSLLEECAAKGGTK